MELCRLHQELHVTTIHITHNHTEAEELAGRIAVMSHGKIEHVCKSHDIFFARDWSSLQLYRFPEYSGVYILPSTGARFNGGGLTGSAYHPPSWWERNVKITISPRDVYVSNVLPPGPSVNRYKGMVFSIEFNSSTDKIDLNIGLTAIKAGMPAELAREMNLIAGKEVLVILKLRR